MAAIVNAKNSTMSRSDMTPEQAVFGRSLKFTEVANRDDDEVLMGVLGNHGLAWKASQIRTAAKILLLERDVTEKIRRAMLRQAPTVIGEVCPGTRVYFWSADPMRGRQHQDHERWRGPATVIARESQGRYYVSWRGQVLLVAREQLRHATCVEAAATEKVQEDVNVTAERDDRQFKNIVDEDAQPRIKPVKKKIVKLKQDQKVPRRVREEIEL